MANPVLDFGAYTPTELTALLTAAKAEYLLRLTTGKVQTGSSAAQSYGFNLMSLADLIRLINGISAQMGLSTVETRVQPNFNAVGLPLPTQSTFGVQP